MIVSHRHRFIFLKTTKTAGTALELALAAHCGPDDVLTPLGRAERPLIEAGRLPIPQNHLLPLRRWTLADVLRAPLRGPPERFSTHMRAAEARAELGAEVWDGYFKFAFTRDPWDRFLSLYHWVHRRELARGAPLPSIDEFVESPRVRKHHGHGYGVYTIDGQVAVDRVCRYERLDEELAWLSARLGLPPLVLPRAKHSVRADRRSPREVLSSRAARRIGEIFAAEAELHGYRF